MEKKFKLQDALKVNVLHPPAGFGIVANATAGPYDRILYFSAKKEETKAKRKQEMVDILLAGFKTRD